MTEPEKLFLSAEWLHLVILNYAVDPSLLQSHVPRGTSLDSFEGKTYLSLVGFRFSKTKLFGKISVPFHSEFEEVNLRFYVSRKTREETRRGVVFIKEIVPKPAIALTARVVYGENYESLPMKHKVTEDAGKTGVEYSWRLGNQWMRLFARSAGVPKLPAEKSLEQYITEHYWGYSRQSAGHTLEYHVTHAPWHVRIASEAGFDGHAAKLYGKEFGQVLSHAPDSAYIADGSRVNVLVGAKIE
jgi:uncharacterized protein